MKDTLLQLREGAHMLHRALRFRLDGFSRYDGSVEKICRQIIRKSYESEKGYFRVSRGNFNNFYIRDFAFCCEALQELGYKKEVRHSLQYALERYSKAKRVTTTISKGGVAFDFPKYGPDSLALLLYAITHTGNEDLAVKHKRFLQSQVDIFVQRVIDPKTLLVRKGTSYSSIRDHTTRKGACYDATMAVLLVKSAKELGFAVPYRLESMRERFIEAYWSGEYFYSDLQRQALVVGDANVFPFWSGIITNAKMRKSSLDAIKNAGLDTPFGLRYVSRKDKKREKVHLHAANWFARDYETHSIWMHLGLAYLRVLSTTNRFRAQEQLRQYTKNLEHYGTFLEVYNDDGTPFTRLFYITDEGMLWCAPYLQLAKKLKITSRDDG